MNAGVVDGLDLHRPYVDEITFTCEECDGTMSRIPEVMDCWFDSGAMPFAQSHYPFENPEMEKDGLFPADYICEAVDQTRGWFYSLHALSTLLKGEPSYKNVICLGLILDERGRKMSKRVGNVVEPLPLLDEHGADALRWYLFTASQPGEARPLLVSPGQPDPEAGAADALEHLLLLYRLRGHRQVRSVAEARGLEARERA